MTRRGSHRPGKRAFGRLAAGVVSAGLAVLAGLLLTIGEAQAVKTSFSFDFQNFIRMVNDRYFVPRGRTLDSMTSTTTRPGDVDAFALALGHALRIQYGYATSNPALMQRYENLQREVLYDYLEYIQNRRGNAYPPASRMRAWAEYGMRGRSNYFTQQPGVQPGAAPSIFMGSQSGIDLPPKKQPPQSGEQIDLLNQRPATDPNFARGKQIYNQGVNYWNAGSQAWNAGQKDTAYAYYQKAAELFHEACSLNFASGCVGSYHYKQGQFMKGFQ
jgi:hypothetical protein